MKTFDLEDIIADKKWQLIVALASNPDIARRQYVNEPKTNNNVPDIKHIIEFANAIIKELYENKS